jgi:hypothetical protein
MLQFFGFLALLLASAQKPQTAIEINGDNANAIPKEAGLEVAVIGNQATVRGEGFEIRASRIMYDKDRGQLICEQALLSKWENSYTLHRTGATKLFYNLKDGSYRGERGILFPAGVMTFPH